MVDDEINDTISSNKEIDRELIIKSFKINQEQADKAKALIYDILSKREDIIIDEQTNLYTSFSFTYNKNSPKIKEDLNKIHVEYYSHKYFLEKPEEFKKFINELYEIVTESICASTNQTLLDSLNGVHTILDKELKMPEIWRITGLEECFKYLGWIKLKHYLNKVLA